MTPQLNGHYCSSRVALKYVVLPLLLVGFAVGLRVPFYEWISPMEAEAAMFPPPGDAPVASIDGERAFGYLKKIVAIGPHTAGSAANTQVRELAAEHFKKLGGVVREQPFAAVHPVNGRALQMANLIASWNPENPRRVVIGAHYDTRPQPDQEVLPHRRNLPFVGANDPGSGIAVLMEIAHHINGLDTQWGVDLVLFDGEELVFGDNPRVGEYFLGSEEFARVYTDQVDNRRTAARYEAGFVLDMVGGKNLKIKIEPKSWSAAQHLVREVWGIARSLRINSFRTEEGQEVRDDHLALIAAGIPTIDIIDFEYPYWHKADDLPNNCSARSLADVARVMTTWLKPPPKAQQAGKKRR